MPITEEEWNQIYDAIEAARAPTEFIFGKVTRVDKGRSNIYCEEEFGDQPIPIASQLFKLVYYDETPKGMVGFATVNPPGNPYKVVKKEVEAEYTYEEWAAQKYVMPAVPPVGSSAIIVVQNGSRRFPVCIGIFVGYTTI